MFYSVSVLLTASIKGFSVSRMQDSYLVCAVAFIPWWGFLSDDNLPLPPPSPPPPPQQNDNVFFFVFFFFNFFLFFFVLLLALDERLSGLPYAGFFSQKENIFNAYIIGQNISGFQGKICNHRNVLNHLCKLTLCYLLVSTVLF